MALQANLLGTDVELQTVTYTPRPKNTPPQPIELRGVTAEFLDIITSNHQLVTTTHSPPLITTRDVHRLVIVPETARAGLCRYVELPAAQGCNLSTGEAYVDRADFFVSHSWDSPWAELVAALQLHTQGIMGGRDPPPACPYYWIDIIAINQHKSLPPWTCDSGLGVECPGCAAVREDMEPDAAGLVGFARVIHQTKRTLLLNEPWDNPRPMRRVWCLFESYKTMEAGGELEVVLGPRQKQELSLNLNARFTQLDSIVGTIDAARAEATHVKDKNDILEDISRTIGIDGFNHALQQRQRLWLAKAAEGVIARTDPRRPPLDAAAIRLEAADIGEGTWAACGNCLCPTGAKRTQLLEHHPRLALMLTVLGMLLGGGSLLTALQGLALMLTVLGMLPGAGSLLTAAQMDSSPKDVNDSSGSDAEAPESLETFSNVLIALTLCIAGIVMFRFGTTLTKHQANRQLRRPAICGDKATLHKNTVAALFLTVFVSILTLATIWCINFLSIRLYSYDFTLIGFSTFTMICSGVLYVGVTFTLAVLAPLSDAKEAATQRALLRARVGWLQSESGEVNKGLDTFRVAEAELWRSVSRNDTDSWVVSPSHARALCDAGRHAEAAHVVDELEELVKNTRQCCNQESKIRRDPSWTMLRARLAAAVRMPDSSVLELLAQAQEQGRPVSCLRGRALAAEPAGWMRVGTDDNVLHYAKEWKEFMDRMSSEEGSNNGEWLAYRSATISKYITAAEEGEDRVLDVEAELIARGLPMEGQSDESDESDEARQERLRGLVLRSVFEHPAWAYS